MKHVYDILDTIKKELRDNPSVHTVTFGNLSEVDLDKTTLFPLSHIFLGTVEHKENVIRFNIDILCADIVDYNLEKSDFDDFYGNDNLQDVLNTQFEVLNLLITKFQRGTLFADKYQIGTQPLIEPFKERFSNELAGWSVSISIDVPNGINIC